MTDETTPSGPEETSPEDRAEVSSGPPVARPASDSEALPSARPIATPPESRASAADAAPQVPLALLKSATGPPVPSVGGTFTILLTVAFLYVALSAVFSSAVDLEGKARLVGMEGAVLVVMQWAIFLILPLVILLAAKSDLRTVYAWHKPRGDLLLLTTTTAVCLVGVVQYVMTLSYVYLAGPYDRLIETLFGSEIPPTADRLAEATDLVTAHTPTELVVVLLIAALTPAICEEHFFRGVIQSSWDKRLPTGATILAVGVVFAAFHLEPVSFPALLVVGLGVGMVTSRSGCILYACLMHFLNNALSVFVHNWSIRNIGDYLEYVGSYDSLPIYLVGLMAGFGAFMARTPRRTKRFFQPADRGAFEYGDAAQDGPGPIDPPRYRPGALTSLGIGVARYWWLAASVALGCSVAGLVLDVRDLKRIAAESGGPPVIEPGPDEPEGPFEWPEEESGPRVIHVRADGYGPQGTTWSSASLQCSPGAAGPSMMASDLPDAPSRKPMTASYAPGLARRAGLISTRWTTFKDPSAAGSATSFAP